jgi:hypothetical protein
MMYSFYDTSLIFGANVSKYRFYDLHPTHPVRNVRFYNITPPTLIYSWLY